jgi:hypothetical protein
MSSCLKRVAGSGDQSLNGLEPYDGKLSRTVLRGGEFRRSKFASPMIPLLFRRIFGSEKNKDILIHFINDILELKDSDRVKEVSFLSTIQVPEIAAKKQSIVDVRVCCNLRR